MERRSYGGSGRGSSRHSESERHPQTVRQNTQSPQTPPVAQTIPQCGGGFGRGAWNKRPNIIPDVIPSATIGIPVSMTHTQPDSIAVPVGGYKVVTGKKQAIKRPDEGGTQCVRSINIITNHFPLELDEDVEIRKYSVKINEVLNDKRELRATLTDSELERVCKELFSTYNPVFSGKNMFTAGTILDDRIYTVELYGKTCKFIIKSIKVLKLKDFSNGDYSDDILEAFSAVVKDYYAPRMFTVGKTLFPGQISEEDDCGFGVRVCKAFRHTIKLTAEGLCVCVDYSSYVFSEAMAVNEFIKEYFGIKMVKGLRREQLENALIGLKVLVQGETYSIRGVSEDKYVLDLGKKNQVRMELCDLVENQLIHRDRLSNASKKWLDTLCLVNPEQRKADILRAMDSEPRSGEAINYFGIKVGKEMQKVQGRVLQPPRLKLKLLNKDQFVGQKLQADNKWSLMQKRLTRGSMAKEWAVIDFAGSSEVKNLVNQIRDRCNRLGVEMERDYIFQQSTMETLLDIDAVEKLLQAIIDEGKKTKGVDRPSLILCAMSRKSEGYNTLKWVAETKFGLVTQCFLIRSASTKGVHYRISLALKINAKLGGSNAELWDTFPFFSGKDQVMFIGADVNHATKVSSKSIAAAVGTLDWPGANRYTSRIIVQSHNIEKIQNFGQACLEIVKAHANHNNGNFPNKIVIFRDGVSDQQFDMALDELLDVKLRLKEKNGYMPMITLIVGQKRFQTRFFPSKKEDGCEQGGNVPSGTVIDTKVVRPYVSDFYMFSHHNETGTSRSKHYVTLYDDMKLSSDEIQRLVFDLCFISCRCTNPISLVPPIYYADMVAYRGRMYYEAAIKKTASKKTATSTSALGSSISSLSIEEKAVDKEEKTVLKLHEKLEDVMFFV